MITDDDDHRQIARDSLFVLAELRVDGIAGEHRVRIRNLSAGGLMSEGSLPVSRGQTVWIKIRNIGWVEGAVAWLQDDRFGVAFREEIDPRTARAPVTVGEGSPRFVRTPLASGTDAAKLRKI